MNICDCGQQYEMEKQDLSDRIGEGFANEDPNLLLHTIRTYGGLQDFSNVYLNNKKLVNNRANCP
jgi:hypothetical protein